MVAPPSDSRFYMTYARARPNELVPWIEEHNVPLLENALHRWSEARGAFLHMWQYDTPHVIDAGGYNVMSSFVTRSGDLVDEYDPSHIEVELDKAEPFYPWSLEEYHEWLESYADEIEWASVMDYSTTEMFDQLWSASDRIEATFENTIKQFDLIESDNASYNLLPVVQGTNLEEFVEFYDRLVDHGIPTEYVGLGSIQHLSGQTSVVDLEEAFREQTDVEAIHGFGIKAEAFSNGATFETADSQAWAYHPSNGRVILDEGDHLRRIDSVDDAYIRTIASFKSYYTYCARLQDESTAPDEQFNISPSATDDEALDQLEAIV